MAGPMMSAPVAATQVAQQKMQEQGAQQLKQGASKFDAAMANKAQAAQQAQSAAQTHATTAAQNVSATNATSKVQHAKMVDAMKRAEKIHLKKVDANQGAQKAGMNESATASVQAGQTQQAGGPMMKMLGDLEHGQGMMDKLIQSGLSGRQFSNSELLSLQAGMYKYTQELELTGKVVEKATSGLKDTLKTQV